MPFKDPEAQREYQRKWLAERRAEWFKGKSCVDCGSTEHLELDHVDSTQKISHKIWSWSQSRRDDELAKCVARCQPCHQVKTLTFDTHRTDHGKRWMYEGHGCRCAPCNGAKAAHNAGRCRRAATQTL